MNDFSLCLAVLCWSLGIPVVESTDHRLCPQKNGFQQAARTLSTRYGVAFMQSPFILELNPTLVRKPRSFVWAW